MLLKMIVPDFISFGRELNMKKDEAVEKLKRQQSLIEELKGENHESPQFNKWMRDTDVAIKKIFPDVHDGHLRFINIQYHQVSSWTEAGRGTSHSNQYWKGLEEAKTLLQSLIEEIEEYWENEDKPNSQTVLTATTDSSDSREVFIVHGQDEAAKLAVARFIERLGLTPTILHEKPSKGRTIIEKFHDYSDVGFAVVLMTPDDIGASADDEKNLKPRARQNVILELGLFLGKLGRKGVCALYKEGVEMPSDYDGVIYVPMDKSNGWQLQLAKEIKAAGIDVDMNKL